MKLSIIIPVYNAEETLEKAVCSMLDSTYKNIEVIIIDDGSDDNSIELLKEFNKVDNRIITLFQKHKGVSCARNLGIEYATGDYILFLDSDDYFDKDGLEKIVGSLDNTMDMLMYHCWLHNEHYPNGKKINVKSEIWKDNKKFLELFLFPKKAMSVWSKVYRRSIIIENNIRFNETLMAYEDLLFNINYLKCCKANVIVSSLNPYHYIVTNKEYSIDLFRKRDMALFLAFELCIRCCNEKEQKQAELLYEELLIKTYRRFIRLKVEDNDIKRKLSQAIKRNITFYLMNGQVSLSMKIYAIILLIYPRIAVLK